MGSLGWIVTPVDRYVVRIISTEYSDLWYFPRTLGMLLYDSNRFALLLPWYPTMSHYSLYRLVPFFHMLDFSFGSLISQQCVTCVGSTSTAGGMNFTGARWLSRF